MKLRESETRKHSGIFEASFAALEHKVRTMWSEVVIEPPLTVITASSHEVQKAIERLTNRQKDEPMPMPYVSIVPALYQRTTAGYNPFALRRLGLSMGKDANNMRETRERVTPLDVGLTVRFVTQNFEEAEMFALLIMAQNTVRMDLVHPDTKARIGIKIKFDEQVSMPEAEFGGEPGDLIKVETTIILSTYSGVTEFNKLIQQIKMSGYQPLSTGYQIEELIDHNRTAVKLFDKTRTRKDIYNEGQD